MLILSDCKEKSYLQILVKFLYYYQLHADVYLAYSLTLRMETTCSSKTSVDYQLTALCHVPADRILRIDRCEDIEAYKITQ
jgi:hypothetical protein